MEQLIKELEPKLKLLETKYDKEIIELHVEYGDKKISVCPKCGAVSERVHSHHTAYAWDMPIQNHKVKLIFHVKEFFCDNENCSQKIFAERFDFLGSTKKRTKRLEKYILDVSKSSSAMQTERLMRSSVAEISNDTIMRLVKKTPENNNSISVAAIDDFALKKRYRYGTVLINAETGTIVDMLESRETSEVAEWLKGFPNIKFFTRDGAGFYANAVRKAHPEAIQIMDRFHILQHLTDCCKKYINRTVKAIEPIELENNVQDIPAFSTVYERIMEAKKLKEQGLSVAEISDALFVMPVTVRKYINMDMDTAKKYDKKTGFEKSEEKANAKEHIFLEVKKLYSEGCTKISICRKLGLTQKTVKKYIEMESLPQRAYNSQIERKKIAPYIDKINELYLQKLKLKEIFKELKILGYTGSISYLERVITEQRKLRFAPPKRKIQRKAVISLLYKSLENIKGLDEESLCAIIERYPKLSELYGFVKSFKAIMFSGHYEQLDEWISEAEKSDIPEIHSFITGIKQDLAAVKAAIRYPHSNGVAEGNVNLIKLLKRVMFGRASFDLLRAKVLLFQSG